MKPYFTIDEIRRAKGVWNGPPAAAAEVKDSLGEYFAFEGLLHEVSHAVARGESSLSINKGSSRRTSDFFDEINAQHPALGLACEAYALGVELVALRLMRLSQIVRLDVVMRDSYLSATTLADTTILNYTLFKKLTRDFSRSPKTKVAAARVPQIMERLLR